MSKQTDIVNAIISRYKKSKVRRIINTPKMRRLLRAKNLSRGKYGFKRPDGSFEYNKTRRGIIDEALGTVRREHLRTWGGVASRVAPIGIGAYIAGSRSKQIYGAISRKPKKSDNIHKLFTNDNVEFVKSLFTSKGLE